VKRRNVYCAVIYGKCACSCGLRVLGRTGQTPLGGGAGQLGQLSPAAALKTLRCHTERRRRIGRQVSAHHRYMYFFWQSVAWFDSPLPFVTWVPASKAGKARHHRWSPPPCTVPIRGRSSASWRCRRLAGQIMSCCDTPSEISEPESESLPVEPLPPVLALRVLLRREPSALTVTRTWPSSTTPPMARGFS